LKHSKIRPLETANYWRNRHFAGQEKKSADFGRQTFEAFQSPPTAANVGDGKTFVVGHLRNFRKKTLSAADFPDFVADSMQTRAKARDYILD